MSTLVLCTNSEKLDILDRLNSSKGFHDYKFMTIEEFRSNYFFSYDYRAIDYLACKYSYDIDVSKTYIESLYTIDINKNYKDEKLIFLKKLKKELIDNNLITFNNYFKEYLKDKKIINYYPVLDKYLDDALKKLNASFRWNYDINKLSYYPFSSIDSEVEFVCQKICELKNKGVSLNNIYLMNVDDNYFMPIRKFFKLYNININLDYKVNLNSFSFVNKYLEDRELPSINDSNSSLVKTFINKVNSISYIEDSPNYDNILRYIIKDTIIESSRYKESVNVCNLFDRRFDSDSYVFLMGFNYGSVPALYKDDMFINDGLKGNLYTTSFKNEREKKRVMEYLSSIPNLCISLKESTYNNKFYPSSLIDEYSISKADYNFSLEYSNKANKRRLEKDMDNLYRYNIHDKSLDVLNSNYKSIYGTYNHEFSGIDSDTFKKYIKNIDLSYTSMNSYFSCPFKYYVNYILKAIPFVNTFASVIGNLFHYILQHSYDDNFDSDKFFDKYVGSISIDSKERFFLSKLKRIIKDEIEIIKDNDQYTLFHERMFEKEIRLLISDSIIRLNFVGKIDKILYYNDLGKIYFSVIDYKTGTYPSNLYNMKYGLSSQLATYLYLIVKGRLFDNPTFTGIYFQNVLMHDSLEGNKDYKTLLRDSLKYDGYSTYNTDNLYKFDNTYVDSKVIKSMKLKSDGTFSSYAKVLSDDDIKSLYNYTEKLIFDAFKNITDRHFDISPIKVGVKDLSCEYCDARDICFRTDSDYRLESENKSLDFLGGDSDAN